MPPAKDVVQFLPDDQFAGTLIGRAWVPANLTGSVAGPSPVWLREDGVYDLSSVAPTCAELLNEGVVMEQLEPAGLTNLGSYHDIMTNTITAERDATLPHFLAPIDLQAIKACGVTFMVSTLERVIEERAGGDVTKAEDVRQKIKDRIGAELSSIVPGSAEAETMKSVLQAEGLWSQYLEVGIGPYAEVFTKGQPMSAVGTGMEVGILDISSWNNPEPEVVMMVNANAEIVGASLGNDVNLRDIEGRSALLLGKAKDNNGSCAIGPFIRLFDDTFSLDDVRQADISLSIIGEDGFELNEVSPMRMISRDITDLVEQTINKNHQYPDGFALFMGTMFAPTQDRDGAAQGFTHKIGDIVSIQSKKLGTLRNQVRYCHEIAPWEFGISALLKNLSQRDIL